MAQNPSLVFVSSSEHQGWSYLERDVGNLKELSPAGSFVFSAEKNYSANRPEAIFELIRINAKDDKMHFLLKQEEVGMFKSMKTINPSQHAMLGYKASLRLNPSKKMNQKYNSPNMFPKEKDTTSFNIRVAIKKLKRKQIAQGILLLLACIFIAGSVTSAKVKTLTSVKKGSIKKAYLARNAVTSDKIANREVKNADLANNSVTSDKIKNGEVKNSDIANNSITSDKIVDGNINSNDLANDSVTTEKIADGQVSSSDLAASSVNSSKISDGSIIAEDIKDGTITAAKMAYGVLTGSGSSAWGSITGTLSDQSDLQEALNDKASKNEITIGDDGYGSTFVEAITAIGSTSATLVVPSGTQEGGGITIPANVTLKVLRGALIHEADGATLTINGSLEAGLYQVFSWDGSGKVVFGAGSVKEVYPEWWANNTTPGTTDMTAAFQAAVTAMTTNNICGKVSLLPTKYKLIETITANSGFTLQGVSPDLHLAAWYEVGGGTWLYFAHTGKGITLDSGSYSDGYIRDIGTYRDQPTPGAGWAPTNHDYDFYLNAGIGFTFDNILLFNATKGIWAGGNSGRANFYNVRGQFFDKGIVIDYALDSCRIDQIHAWTYWSANDNVTAYTKEHLDTIQLARVDNPLISNVFSIYSKSGIRFSQNEDGQVSLIHASNLDFDEGLYAIWVDSSVTHGVTGQIVNLTHMGQIAGSIGVYVQGDNSRLYFTNYLAQFDYLNSINASGTSNKLYFNGLEIIYYDQSGTSVPAVHAIDTNTVTISPRPNIITGYTGVGGKYSTTGQINIDDWRSYTPVVTAHTGTITTLGTVNGHYKLVGNTVYVTVDVAITTNGDGADWILVSLPFGTPTAESIGAGKQIDGAGNALTVWVPTAGSDAIITKYDNTYPGGDGYGIVATFEYPI